MTIQKNTPCQPRYTHFVHFSIFALAMFCFMAVVTPSSFAARASTHMVVDSSVNINKASSEQLAQGLAGVGVKKAEAIVAYRLSKGKFKSIEELTNVKGIGPSILKKNRSVIKI